MRKIRKYTVQEKQQIIDEVKMVKNMAAVAKKNNVPIGTLHAWVKKDKIKKSEPSNTMDYKRIKQENATLKLENNILKELLKKTVQVLE